MTTYCKKCGKVITIDEIELSKGKYCYEHAARAYKWALIKSFEERDELIQLLVRYNINPTETKRRK